MTQFRSYLVAVLKRVADGGDITTDELELKLPDPMLLDHAERRAWEELSHWADDDDIRATDSDYAAFKRDWLRGLLAALEA